MAENSSTFSESWYRIANQRISLRSSVKVRRQNFRGQRWFVLENPFSNQYFRLRPAAYEFVARLRPDRTVEQVWKECLERFPDDAPGQEAVIQLLSQLYQSGLLQYDLAEDTAQLFRRYERTRQRETRSRLLNIMFMRFPLLDPDQFLIRTLPVIGKLISPVGGMIWLAVVLSALKIVVDHFPALRDQSQGILAPSNLFLLYTGMVLIKTCHEFGHAYFCRRYGGEVHVMGIMLMIFTPIPYVDATSSWGFRSRRQRILVGAAGMIVELFIAALATFVWVNTGQGTLHSLAYNMMFVASVSTLVFNLNPLLRFDGYYILSDWLEIPNLQQRANQQLKFLAERHLFGLKNAESPANSRTEAGWLTGFGILSGIYRVIVFGGILLFVADRFLLLGIVMAIVCLISWIMVPLSKLVIYLASSPRLARNRIRAISVTAGSVMILLSILQFVPVPNHFRAPGVLKSREWTEVLTESPGRLEQLMAEPGVQVNRGQPLARLSNPELDLDLAQARAKHDEIQARLRHALQEATSNLKPLQSLLDSASLRLRRLEQDKAALTLRARQTGIWVSPRANEFVGRWVPKGTGLGLLIDPSSFQFLAPVAQEDGDSLFARAISRAEVRLLGQSETVLAVEQFSVIPAERQNLPSPALGWAAGGEVPVTSNDPEGQQAIEPFFEVRADLKPGFDATLLHGRSGKIRFDLPPEPLLPKWMRRLRQLLQRRYQL
jgi:putative peptide zinc metalloprotease protein